MAQVRKSELVVAHGHQGEVKEASRDDSTQKEGLREFDPAVHPRIIVSRIFLSVTVRTAPSYIRC